MEERNSKYTIETSRNGDHVPVINGIYLHSVYNPKKEAEAFALEHIEKLQKKNTVLVLGLGFGYHIQEIATRLSAFHNSNYKIVVLEPSEDLIYQFNQKKGFSNPNIEIQSFKEASDGFNNWEFVEFLMAKPLIIKHDTSFNVHKKFFAKFLSYNAPKDLESMSSILSEDSSQIAAAIFNQNNTNGRVNFLAEAFKSIANKSVR